NSGYFAPAADRPRPGGHPRSSKPHGRFGDFVNWPAPGPFLYTYCSISKSKLRIDMAFTFVLNGKSTTVDVPADMPLLWVIRDVLDLKGTKFGCGAGLCGACTVHLDGRAIRSCQTPVSTVASKQVTTLEG